MASQFEFLAEARDDLIIVTERRCQFSAIYEQRAGRPELVLVRRSSSADDALLVAASRAASDKARELGWFV